MGKQWLAVSNPPHGDVDPWSAAGCLGLSPAEAMMKVNFPAPEVWLAGSKKERMEEAVGTMRDAEMRVALLDADQLLSVPPQQVVKAFAFDETSFVPTVDRSEVSIDYDAPITGIFVQPPQDQTGENRKVTSLADRMGKGSSSALFGSVVRSGPDLSDTLEEATFLDLYDDTGPTTERISIAEDLVDFSGLGDAVQPKAAENMALFVSECEHRFSRMHLDARLVGVKARRRIIVGEPNVRREGRKLYSFGTRELATLLESISPELGEMTQADLGSRLAFLMREEGLG